MTEQQEATRLSQITGVQWRSGIAAWLGWTFDGLELHLYTLVATVFIAQLITPTGEEILKTTDPAVTSRAGLVQAAFLLGWAIGGGFFGAIGDRIGRSRALALTILTYAIFTGMSSFATEWWHLLIFRFISALGIGGEWAVGASLLAETWPKSWRPWLAAVLQTGVNFGVLLASFLVFLAAGLPERWVFLIGVLPALMVFWIRKSVPETEEWSAANATRTSMPTIADLFKPDQRRMTLLIIAVCALSLTAHWAFMFWATQHLKTLWYEGSGWLDDKSLGATGLMIMMIFSIMGNFAAGAIAFRVGYRGSVIAMCAMYFVSMFIAYSVSPSIRWLLFMFAPMGFSQGLFAIFTMYLPSLFPTLLRTTGAGFCYNIGRIAAAIGTVIFGVASVSLDYQQALFWTAFLFLPAIYFATQLPEPRLGTALEK